MRPAKVKTTVVGLIAVAASVALAGCGTSAKKGSIGAEAMQTYAAMTMPIVAAERAAAQAQPSKDVTMIVKSDEEHARKGPEGEWHDAFLPARIAAAPGQRVNVTVYNYDEGDHSFTSPTLGLNVTLPGGLPKAPHKTTFSFVAPKRAGRYEWFCIFPCDPWAMTNTGYMHGYVTVTA